VRASESGGVIRVGNIEVQRDFIDVAEAARILLGLAGAAEWPWSLVNLCSGKAFRLEALLQAMIRSSGRRVRLQVDPALLRPQDMPLLVGNTERLGALGLFPEEPDFETLIPQLIAEPHSHIRNSS
jgi:GDP-4-dehydro-6-deoxy-D-mannose reductase